MVFVKVIFDRAFAAPGDEQQALDTRLVQLFDDVLHNRLFADC